MRYDIIIIGAGVVGCAIARELSKYSRSILVLEKEGDVAEGISKANSGVVHAGFNVKAGSLKARFNLEGLACFPAICETLDVPYKLSKKLVVAKDKTELTYLEKLLEQGKKNGCPGLSIIGKEKIAQIEPLVRGEFALYSEATAVISPYGFTIALAESAHINGAKFRFNSEVTGIAKKTDGYSITLSDGSIFESNIVINSAGLYSDAVLSMIEQHDRSIHPCRGEYYILDKAGDDFIKAAVYPVPPADGRGLGIHLTPTTDGNIIIGPSAEYINEKWDTANTKEVMDTLKKEAYELIPELRNIPFIKNYSGIRPKLFKAGGKTTFEDFIIEESSENPNFFSLIGIESPGLTAAPAIAKYVAEMVGRNNTLEPKSAFIAGRRGVKTIAEASPSEIAALIEKDKNYADIVCRCNHISKAEILAAINNRLGVRTLNAIKKRSHAMMGRCQSGFCLPRISEILTCECGMAPEDVVKNNDKSRVLTGYED